MKKKTECQSCNDLIARLDRMEKRLDKQEQEKKYWKKRWASVDRQLQEANGRISLLEAENKQLKKTIEKKDAEITSLKKKIFGESTEVTPPEEEVIQEAAPPKLPRGKQRGARGYGRKIESNLPCEELFHDLDEFKKLWSSCGKKRELIPFTEDSEEIHYSYKLVRVRHKRKKYKRVCQCKNVRTIETASAPDKLFPKSKYSVEFWVHILIEKFLLQRPISRICWSLDLQGLNVSDGTIASGLKKLCRYFAPLYNQIRARNKDALHRHMDETHWRVFVDLIGKENHKWWLWVSETKDTSLFTLDPSRSSEVPKMLLRGVDTGFVSCDRYSSYKPLLEQGLELSYCWSHVRRDFIKLKDGYPFLRKFAALWIRRIDQLFHLCRNRPQSQEQLDDLCGLMKRSFERYLKKDDLHDAARSALSSMQNHWHGLTLFLQFPELPPDNNAAERALRNSVVGRKNYHGSRSLWSGYLSAMLFSLFGTLKKNDVDPYQFLVRYLKTCAKNHDPPKDLLEFLPWQSHPLTMVQ